jgi:hypothetical protein
MSVERAELWMLRVLLFAVVAQAILLTVHYSGVLQPRPYRNVEVLSVDRLPNGDIDVQISYIRTKSDCAFIRAVAAGSMVGVPLPPLPYRAIRGANQTEDRLPGSQLLRWVVDPMDRAVDRISIRTEHACNGRTIRREMVAVDVPPI